MKKIVLITLLIGFLASMQIFAQPRFDVKEQIKNLKTELELSDSQATVIEKILISQRDKIRDVMESFEGDRSEMRTEMRKMRTVTDEQIKAVLNEGQIEKYDKYVKENSKRRRGNRR